MERTLKNFLTYGLNKLEKSDPGYRNGERYQVNDYFPQLSTTYFRSKKEAMEYWKREIEPTIINTLPKIIKLAKKEDVRVSVKKEKGKRVIVLHGFLNSVQAVAREITGYWIEKRDTGYYLYSEKTSWE